MRHTEQDKYIIIAKGNYLGQRAIRSSSNWFADCEYFLFKEVENTLVIEKMYGVNYNRQAYRKMKKGDFTILSNLPNGTYYFDEEETNEDKAVIILN